MARARVLLCSCFGCCGCVRNCVQPQISDSSTLAARFKFAVCENGGQAQHRAATNFQHHFTSLPLRLASTSIGRKGEMMHHTKPTRTFPRAASRPAARGEWAKHAIGSGREDRNFGVSLPGHFVPYGSLRSFLPSSRPPLMLPTFCLRCREKSKPRPGSQKARQKRLCSWYYW